MTYKSPLGEEQVTMPLRFKGRSGEIDVAPLGNKFSEAKLYLMNKDTGNLAILDYSAPQPEETPKPIKLKQDDFEYVRAVRLRIVSEDGAPVEAAVVDITDGEGRPMRAVVTPADQGIASFGNVASGEISVKVRAEGLTKTIDKDISLPGKRRSRDFEEEVRVAGDVNTLPVPKTEKPAAGATAGPKAETGAGSAVIWQSIAALVFIIVVIAVIWAIIRSKGITAADALKRMGVEVPGDQAAGTAQAPQPAIDPNVCPFCGQRKDAAGNCACSITPGAVPGPVGAGGPRLVGVQGPYAGHIFELSAASMTIGRESGEIVLSSDSTVSRRHATITESGGAYSIRDEGSSNGTLVNGAKITEHKLMPGDEVQVGGTKFRFEV